VEAELARRIRTLYASGLSPYEIYEKLKKNYDVELADVFSAISTLVSPGTYNRKRVFLERFLFLRTYFLDGVSLLVKLRRQLEKQKKERVAVIETAKLAVSVLGDMYKRLRDMWGIIRQMRFDGEVGEFEYLSRDVENALLLRAKGVPLDVAAGLIGVSADDLERSVDEAVASMRFVEKFFVDTLVSMAMRLKEEIFVFGELISPVDAARLGLRQLLNDVDSFIYDVRRAKQWRGGVAVRTCGSEGEDSLEARLREYFGDRVSVERGDRLVVVLSRRGTTWNARRFYDVLLRVAGVPGRVRKNENFLIFEEDRESFDYPNQLGEAIRIAEEYADSVVRIETVYPAELFPSSLRRRVVRIRGNRVHTRIVFAVDDKLLKELKMKIVGLEEAKLDGDTLTLLTVGV